VGVCVLIHDEDVNQCGVNLHWHSAGLKNPIRWHEGSLLSMKAALEYHTGLKESPIEK